tara:strand:+ start:120 stop:722 length:603 start_codon:yes stop_codon:yes gene_type:complete
MKKNITILLVLLTSFVYCQEESYTSYESEYFEDEFNINISKNTSAYSFVIYAQSIDNRSKRAALIIKEKLIPNFIGLLQKSKEKYIEWTAVAKQNKIDEFDKIIDYKSKKYRASFTYGDWQNDYKVILQATYKVIESGYVVMIENKYKLKSASNQFIKSEGFMFVFKSEKDFDDLISKIDIKKAKEVFLKNSKELDLFKN